MSVFILFHLIVIPLGSYFSEVTANRNSVQQFLVDYVFALRVRQYWALFSPEPRRYAMRYRAEIAFRDGQTTTWQRPYPPQWDFFARHLSYNFQKWDLVSNYLDVPSGLWDSLVNFLSQRYADPLNPIASIRLIRSRAPWPEPKAQGYVGGDREELSWSDETVFTWDARERRFL